MAATFWAKGSNKIKAPDTSPPSISAPLPLPQTPTRKFENPAVFKPMSGSPTNGVTNITVPSAKKLDWADEEGDEAFYKSIGTIADDTRIAVLEDTVRVQSERTSELETTLILLNKRVQDLEGDSKEKDDRIAQLVLSVTEKDASIASLEKQNYEQILRVKEFAAELDEKDRCVKTLEEEPDHKGVLVHKLEAEPEPVAVSQDQTEGLVCLRESDADKCPSTDIITPTQTKEDQHEHQQSDDNVSQPSPSVSGSTAAESVCTDPPNVDLNPATSQGLAVNDSGLPNDDLSPETPQATGPAVIDSEFPVFVTAESLKVVPPPPKPKTLVFPKTQFFAKLEQKSPKPDVASTSTFISSQEGVPRRARRKTDVIPSIDPSKDFRKMSREERVLFANGLDVEVKMGAVTLSVLPKYVLMQCSSRAYNYFKANPQATSIDFGADLMNADAAQAHCQWMDEMTYQGRVFSLTVSHDSSFDVRNMNICMAARVMGLNSMYVSHFIRHICNRIRTQNISAEVMDLICKSQCMSIVECLANNLITQARRDAAGTKELLSSLRAKYEVFRKKTDEVEQRVGGVSCTNDQSRGLENSKPSAGKAGA